MFILLFQRRKDRIVIYGDWRFTSAFICGCAKLNLSTLLLIGPNTNALCLGRMWTFHLFFVFALAPLMVKTWRVYKLVGKDQFRRKTISNRQTLALTAPFILTQIIILLVFTYIDPPEAKEIIEISLDGTHFQNFLCRHESRAFMAVQILFEGGLVLIGCCLAWKTRNMDEKFGEAKQMILAMYNIAFIALVIMLVSTFVSVEEVGKYALQAMGVLWGTVFSSAAFVVPRLLQNSKDRKQGNQTRISGLSARSGTSINE